MIFLIACASQQEFGTITPLREGYIAEYTSEYSAEHAKSVALNTAEKECNNKGKSFFVIEQIKDGKNTAGLTDSQADITNLASQLLLGGKVVSKEKTVRLHFDCK